LTARDLVARHVTVSSRVVAGHVTARSLIKIRHRAVWKHDRMVTRSPWNLSTDLERAGAIDVSVMGEKECGGRAKGMGAR
jgi:hypothetical protein